MLQTSTREINANKPKNWLGNHFKQYIYVHTITREIIPNKSYKLVQEKSLPTVLTYYYLRIIPNNNLQTITIEIIANCAYKSLSDNSIHSKQYFLFITHNTDNSVKTIIRKFITNNAFKYRLNPATSKVKGNITYQNTNFSAMNLVTRGSILGF